MNKQFDCLPEEDRPYEKCIRYGVQALTNRELLAVILRTGAKGKHVLDLAGELLNLVPEREGFTGIRRLSMTELSAVHGIGKVKAALLPDQEHVFPLLLSSGSLPVVPCWSVPALHSEYIFHRVCLLQADSQTVCSYAITSVGVQTSLRLSYYN